MANGKVRTSNGTWELLCPNDFWETYYGLRPMLVFTPNEGKSNANFLEDWLELEAMKQESTKE